MWFGDRVAGTELTRTNEHVSFVTLSSYVEDRASVWSTPAPRVESSQSSRAPARGSPASSAPSLAEPVAIDVDGRSTLAVRASTSMTPSATTTRAEPSTPIAFGFRQGETVGIWNPTVRV